MRICMVGWRVSVYFLSSVHTSHQAVWVIIVMCMDDLDNRSGHVWEWWILVIFRTSILMSWRGVHVVRQWLPKYGWRILWIEHLCEDWIARVIRIYASHWTCMSLVGPSLIYVQSSVKSGLERMWHCQVLTWRSRSWKSCIFHHQGTPPAKICGLRICHSNWFCATNIDCINSTAKDAQVHDACLVKWWCTWGGDDTFTGLQAQTVRTWSHAALTCPIQ